MQNLLIICADKELRKDISKFLATQHNCLYVDVDEVLNFELLNSQNVNMSEAKQVLQKLEIKSINRVKGFNNCFVTISRDLFLSNDNFKLLDNYKKIFISLSKSYFIARTKTDDKYRLDQELVVYDKINMLINQKSDIEIEKGIKSIEEISKEIIDKLKKS